MIHIRNCGVDHRYPLTEITAGGCVRLREDIGNATSDVECRTR